jgi:hypothetical protein
MEDDISPRPKEVPYSVNNALTTSCREGGADSLKPPGGAMTSAMVDVNECKLRMRDLVCARLHKEAVDNERTSDGGRQVISKKNVGKRASERGCYKRM